MTICISLYIIEFYTSFYLNKKQQMDIVEKIRTSDDFLVGSNNTPNKQLAAYRNVINNTKNPRYISDEELKQQIMFIIMTNPICSYCLKKDVRTLEKLNLCDSCKIEWYCSIECRILHFNVHSKYCCNIDGDWPSNSPFRPILI